MKGIQGLIIAIGLGIVGDLFNFAYLYNRSQDTENEEFIGIAANANVARGDVLKEELLVPVTIPRKDAGKLKDFAFSWSGRVSVINQRVTRTVSGGSILLRIDMETPPQTLAFSPSAAAGDRGDRFGRADRLAARGGIADRAGRHGDVHRPRRLDLRVAHARRP